jgi:hypothetical protein
MGVEVEVEGACSSASWVPRVVVRRHLEAVDYIQLDYQCPSPLLQYKRFIFLSDALITVRKIRLLRIRHDEVLEASLVVVVVVVVVVVIVVVRNPFLVRRYVVAARVIAIVFVFGIIIL